MNSFIALPGASRDRSLRLEYRWIEPEGAAPDGPVTVFLHEGLGCVELWRGFPAALRARLRGRGLVYSRFAYGASTPRPHGEAFPADDLEREARDVLPALLEALAIERP
ncbi:MAG: alpha/beta hydrolase [Azoarcus sp.]|jgi:pimeloyl-ACP methyl ester carboxylesterase|nr:alpha/beta hydrolase [Azoarcus sp.]